MKNENQKWPIAKVRKEDGLIAVWLTHENWMAIEQGIINQYLQHREWMGHRKARIEAKTAEILDAWPFDSGLCQSALELYEVGWKAYKSTLERRNPVTPARLIEMGEGRELQGYREERKKLATPTGRWVTADELMERLRNGRGHQLTGSRTIEGFDVWPEEKGELWHMSREEYKKFNQQSDAEYQKRRGQ